VSEFPLKMWCHAEARLASMRTERGATAVEYAIMLAFIAAIIVAIVTALGEKTSNAFQSVNSQFNP
jgi:pilus assembly protein Flp/PilA